MASVLVAARGVAEPWIADAGVGNPAPAQPLPAGSRPQPRVLSNLVSPLEGVPVNGSLLFDDLGAAPRTVQFLSAAHRTDGSVRLIDGYAVVTPTEPLQPNVAYSVTPMADPGVASNGPMTLTFGPPWEPSWPEVTSELSIERIDVPLTQRCCASAPNFPGAVPNCFLVEARSVVLVRPSFSTMAAAVPLSQFLFRVKAAGATVVPSHYELLSRRVDPPEWEAPHPEYCVELEAMEIKSGRTHTYPAPTSRCMPHGDLGEIGIRSIPVDRSRLAGAACMVPPPGLEAMWCEVNQPVCENAIGVVGCENFQHLCRGGLPPVPPPTMRGLPPVPGPTFVRPPPIAGKAAARGGGSGAADAPRAKRAGAGFGCAVNAGEGGSDLAAIALVTGLILARWCRRRAT